jgi:hypothetical protein
MRASAHAAIKTPTPDHWTFHDLRRNFASGLAKLGALVTEKVKAAA